MFAFRQPRQHLPIDRGRMMDHVGVVAEIVGDLLDRAKSYSLTLRNGTSRSAR